MRASRNDGHKTMMKIGKAGLELLKSFEKYVGHTYDDADPQHRPVKYGDPYRGVLTIGYGHTGRYATPGMTMSLEQAETTLMEEDLPRYERAVNRAVTAPMNQNQFDAFVCLCYNIGVYAFENKASAVRKFNEGDVEEAAKRFKLWNKSKGKVLEGLNRRRAAEVRLFLTPPEAFE